MTHHVLDPIERTSEVLFGLIMVLTLTSSIRVTEGSQPDVRSVLGAAIGCNLAWGLVDAVMFVMTNFMERARNLATFRAVRQAPSAKTAQARILDSLPRVVSDVLTSAEIESLHQRLVRQADPPQDVREISHHGRLSGAPFLREDGDHVGFRWEGAHLRRPRASPHPGLGS